MYQLSLRRANSLALAHRGNFRKLRQAFECGRGRELCTVDGKPIRKQRRFVRQDSEMLRLNSVEFEARNDPAVLVKSLQEAQRKATEERVPWFLANMPKSYERLVHPDTKLEHLSAVVGIQDLSAVSEVFLRSGDGTISVIAPRSYPGQLTEQLKKLPQSEPLSALNLFNSVDGLVSINMFNFSSTEQRTSVDPNLIKVPNELQLYVNDLQAGTYLHDDLHAKPSSCFEDNELKKYLAKCDPGFIERSSPRRFCKQMAMYYDLLARGTDEVAIDIESNWGGNKQMMITLALTNVIAREVLMRVCPYLESRSLEIERSHLDIVDSSDTVAMLRMLVKPAEDLSNEQWISFEADTREELLNQLPQVSKWLDERVLALSEQQNMLPSDAEITIGLLDLVHGIKASQDPYGFSRTNVASVLNRPQLYKAVELFKRRFDPRQEYPERNEAILLEKLQEIRKEVDAHVEIDIQKKVLNFILDLLPAVKRTNAFVSDRFGLAMRLDGPITMNSEDVQRTETPFGVYFVSGRRFTGFHVRFRDIARGGLRVVTPLTEDMFTIESARQLNECYDLAFAQQLKNKDIPEGGSKAVCLVNMRDVNTKDEKAHVVNKSVVSFVNSLLDLITPEEETTREINDFLENQELIYLGPDEQITPVHINWIIKRAEERHYPMATAFMSSKPDAGINHKEYGVTSEGVAVFLDEALKSVNIPTSEPFTVKITGGPDGDVAGNMLKILHRNYGENCRVVGIADGTGCVEDPEGIEWSELLRLFHQALPLSDIDRSKLKGSATVYKVDTQEGETMRNTMHNRVKADAFIPAGGRPATINDSNWSRFLLKEQGPGGERVASSQLIVEGANLFLTPGARKALSKYCVIVKDSSANKCGVICSSFEIMACMLLSKSEFLGIKEDFVKQVLDRLRTLARREAQLMFREYRKDPSKPLPPVSEKISRTIIRASDKAEEALRLMAEDELFKTLAYVADAIPQALLTKASWSEFQDKIPLAYTRNLISVVLGSELVYREGIDYINSISDEQLGNLVLDYARESQFMSKLAEKVLHNATLSPDESQIVANVISEGGARTFVEHGKRT